MRSRFLTAALALSLLSSVALAAPPEKKVAAEKHSTPEEPSTEEARNLYGQGLDFVKKAQWSDALASFERSRALRPHAMTTYNIGACERALGRYTKARSTLLRAIQEGKDSAGQLPPSLVTEAQGYVQEIDRILSRVHVTLDPADAGIAVDGRPLARGDGVMIAGIEPPGPGVPPPSPTFDLVLDPGAHLVTLTRKGYADVVLNRTTPPGSTGELRLELERLPAVLHVSSSVSGAVVTVNGMDVGTAPVDVQRPAGSYRIVVRKDGFYAYQAQMNVNAGEETDLRAALVEERTPVTKKWWFWAAAGAVVAGAAVGTYYATRTEPDPVRPPLDGGSLGWTARVR
jgi:hypothetical protein